MGYYATFKIVTIGLAPWHHGDTLLWGSLNSHGDLGSNPWSDPPETLWADM